MGFTYIQLLLSFIFGYILLVLGIILFVVPSYVSDSTLNCRFFKVITCFEGKEVYDTRGAPNSLKSVLFASFVPRYDTNLFISFFCVKGQNN